MGFCDSYHAREGSDGHSVRSLPPPALSAPHFGASKNPVAGKPFFTDVDGEKVIVALLPNDFPYNIGKDVRCVPAAAIRVGGIVGRAAAGCHHNQAKA